MAEAVKVNPEQRMLIDGKLVEADSGKTFENVNPATEEVIGEVADGSTAEMQRAIDAARRAFDETDWSTNHAFRKQCLEQLHEALQAEHEELREQLILEVGCPRMTTNGPQLDAPISEAFAWPAKQIDEFEWETVLPDATNIQGSLDSRRIWREPVGVVGAIVPWNFPFEVTSHKLGQALATGNTVVLKPAPDTPWNATLLGRIVAEKTDIPAGVLNIVTSSDHLIGEELTLSPKVDMISFTGSTVVGPADHGEGRRHHEARLPRARRQVGHHRARGRRPQHRHHDGHGRLLPRRAGLRDPDPDAAAARPLRRGRRDAARASSPPCPSATRSGPT